MDGIPEDENAEILLQMMELGHQLDMSTLSPVEQVKAQELRKNVSLLKDSIEWRDRRTEYQEEGSANTDLQDVQRPRHSKRREELLAD